MPLAYFSVMETIQAITYSYIGECGRTVNETLTYLSYIHIAFQPFFVNMFAMSWLGKEVRKTLKWVWPLCAFTTAIFFLMLLPIPKFGRCDPALQTLCGDVICSYKGEWHIAWALTLNELDPYHLAYWTIAFIVPIVYGTWRFVLYHFLAGPFLAHWLTSDKNERPAIWCLLSIALLFATHTPAIARWLTVKPKKKKSNLSLS